MFQFFVLFSSIMGLFLYAAYRFKWTMTGVLLGALICFPFLAKTEEWDWFRDAKTYSVLIPLFFYSLGQAVFESRKNPRSRLARFMDPLRRRAKRLCDAFLKTLLVSLIWLMPLVFIVNIFEASLEDFLANEVLNSLVGLTLILTIPNFWGKWHFNRYSLLGFGSYPDWCIVYTLWNARFVQTYTGGLLQNSFSLMTILLIGLIVCWACKDWHVWIFCRGFSLGFVLVSTGFFPGLTERLIGLIPASRWALSERSLTLWACLNLLAAAYLVYRTVKEKRNCLAYSRRIRTERDSNP